LAKKLGLSEAQVQKWYVQRRENGKIEDNRAQADEDASIVEPSANTQQVVAEPQQQEVVKKKGRGRPPKKKPVNDSISKPDMANSNSNNDDEPTEANKENVNGDVSKEESNTFLKLFN